MVPGSPRPPLTGELFDIVVIGGGVNGVAIARECARAEKRVLLVEQNDFASGTTSRATRIIHGGLRYLEHGELGLVRESLRERERLLSESANLVRPLNFLLAMPKGSRRSALEVRFGLWLYRFFARRKPVNDPAPDLHRLEQLLDRGQQWSIFSYEDAQCEYPERLIAEWLHAAGALNVTVRNHTEAIQIDKKDGAVSGVRVRDRLTGDESIVECDWVINAAGPWADAITERAGIVTDEPLIGGVRGSHIVLPNFAGAPEAAVYTEAVDGRPMFILPWADQTLVGTTEERDEHNPDYVTPSQAEIDYLLRSFQRLFPSTGFTASDIRCAFAGIRPLPYITEQSPNSITRRHFIIDHKDDGLRGMISIVGGKLTTAKSLAREVARAIGIEVQEPAGFTVLDVPSHPYNDTSLRQLLHDMVVFARISLKSVRAVESIYGPFAITVFNTIQQDDTFRRPLCAHTSHVVGEAVYSARREHALTLGDILLRRVPVALGPCWSEDCTRTAAERIGHALHWTPDQIAHQMHNFQEEYDRFLIKPARTAGAR